MEQRIRAFIVDNFLYGDDAELSPDLSLTEEGVIDSTGVLELVTFIEEEFEIRVEDEDLVPENFETIAAMAAYISRKQGAALAA